ncbi:MAG: HAMP domain-containing sensor histidine kinase, partial [Candidatus Eremiobacterota bacterium]
FGFFTTAPAVALGLATLPGAGPGLPAFLYVASVTLRTLTRGRPEPGWRLSEWLADALPAMAAIAVVGAVGVPQIPLLAAAVWLVLAWGLPGLLAVPLAPQENQRWAEARSRVAPLLPGVAAAGLAIGSPNGWGLYLLPLLFSLQRIAGPLAGDRLVPRFRLERAEEECQRLFTSLQETRYQLEHVHAMALRKADELRGLEQLTRALTRSQALHTTLQVILNMSFRAAPTTRSAVVFFRQDGHLVPVAYRTPCQARLLDAHLLRLKEPIVTMALEQGSAVCLTQVPPGPEPRIFDQETAALAVPLDEEGVLYLGTCDPAGFSEQSRELVAVVAAQGAVAIQSARRLQSEQMARQLHREAHERLKHWLDRLALMLDGTREAFSTLDLSALTERMAGSLQRAVPHQFGAILDQGLEPLYLWPAGDVLDRKAMRELAESVRKNRRPLVLLNPVLTMVARQSGLVAVPWMAEREFLGVVMLGRTHGQDFSREDQDLVQLIAYMLAAGYRNARLHQELKDSQARLLHASKLAAVGQLAAGVAHELNTPLGAVLMATELAVSRLPEHPDAALRKLDRVLSAATQAQRVVANLLVYSRGEEAMELVDLSRLVEDTMTLVDYQLKSQGVYVTLRLGQAPAVLGNSGQLQQVLTHLLSNAGQSGGKSVTLELFEDARGAVVAVEDDGPGISGELAERVFEPFFTTRPVGRGTGLGLAVSHQIAHRHGGSLELIQRPGRGARFVLTLPACPD